MATTPVAGAAAPTTPLGGSATENCYSVACWTEPSAFYPVSAPRRLVPFPFSARQSAPKAAAPCSRSGGGGDLGAGVRQAQH